MNNVFVAMLAK